MNIDIPTKWASDPDVVALSALNKRFVKILRVLVPLFKTDFSALKASIRESEAHVFRNCLAWAEKNGLASRTNYLPLQQYFNDLNGERTTSFTIARQEKSLEYWRAFLASQSPFEICCHVRELNLYLQSPDSSIVAQQLQDSALVALSALDSNFLPSLSFLIDHFVNDSQFSFKNFRFRYAREYRLCVDWARDHNLVSRTHYLPLVRYFQSIAAFQDSDYDEICCEQALSGWLAFLELVNAGEAAEKRDDLNRYLSAVEPKVLEPEPEPEVLEPEPEPEVLEPEPEPEPESEQKTIALPTSKEATMAQDRLEQIKEGVRSLLESQLENFHGVTTKVALFGAVQAAFDDLKTYGLAWEDEIYGLARQLCGPGTAQNYAFTLNKFVLREAPTERVTNAWILRNYASGNDGLLELSAWEEYCAKLSVKAEKPSSCEDLVQVDESRFLLMDSSRIGPDFMAKLTKVLSKLLTHAKSAAPKELKAGNRYFVAPRNIAIKKLDTSLSALPHGLRWSLEFLQALISKIPLGVRLVRAGRTAKFDSLAAAIVPEDSAIQTFGDLAYACARSSVEEGTTLSVKDFKALLATAGLIGPKELSTASALHKACGETFFTWSEKDREVTVGQVA